MTQVAQAARSAWTQAQSLAVFAICIGTSMVVPVALVTFHVM